MVGGVERDLEMLAGPDLTYSTEPELTESVADGQSGRIVDRGLQHHVDLGYPDGHRTATKLRR